ncbi:MAG: hypothetical protein ACHQT8_01955 [Chlamydiales bacterium]
MTTKPISFALFEKKETVRLQERYANYLMLKIFDFKSLEFKTMQQQIIEANPNPMPGIRPASCLRGAVDYVRTKEEGGLGKKSAATLIGILLYIMNFFSEAGQTEYTRQELLDKRIQITYLINEIAKIQRMNASQFTVWKQETPNPEAFEIWCRTFKLQIDRMHAS